MNNYSSKTKVSFLNALANDLLVKYEVGVDPKDILPMRLHQPKINLGTSLWASEEYKVSHFVCNLKSLI